MDNNIDVNYNTDRFGIIGDLMMIDYPKFLIGNNDNIYIQLHDNMNGIYILNISNNKCTNYQEKVNLLKIYEKKIYKYQWKYNSSWTR